MNLYFDTSALAKLFHEEEGTNLVTELIYDESNSIWINEIARLELTSALNRRYRRNELNLEQLKRAIEGINKELAIFSIQPLNKVLVNEANELMQKYGKIHKLRTLDALHIAGFIILSSESHYWELVSSDAEMCLVADKLEYSVINPLKK